MSRSERAREDVDADSTLRDRAQLFLVGALSLAVVFVALSLILNSAIYTENLATRSTDAAGGAAALETRADVEDGVAGLIEYENRNRASVDPTAVESGVRELDSQVGNYNIRNGRVVNVSLAGDPDAAVDVGTAVAQSDGPFVAADEDPGTDWTVASDVDGLRAFEQRVRIDSLASDSEDAFATEFDDGSDVHEVRLLRVGDDDLRVEVDGPSGTEQCALYDGASATDEYVTVDLTSATVGGEPCPALEFFEESATYDISYVNSDQVSGTYRFVINEGSIDESGPDPKDVIYAVTVELTYYSADLDYETTIRVAPGEPDA
ncbi:DUF7261 family protein [Haloprofundus halophilus]|uniref:DUF7261 family protein n=1 Tax=Haloprofundus halophilus TaxID=2283527 RepID=UPI000E43C4D6|nr:hypothetical protein [Haloprofundus halophilus]